MASVNQALYLTPGRPAYRRSKTLVVKHVCILPQLCSFSERIAAASIFVRKGQFHCHLKSREFEGLNIFKNVIRVCSFTLRSKSVIKSVRFVKLYYKKNANVALFFQVYVVL